ncbi:quinoprotein relay system zinc metallohydrolase 2 [Methylococcus sp. EFPC2]|uniref:quinoprotein relay system zinc metallohydrolase 2 n=1 Tax=Methylococcus sp. EFPC2 TaxID=2812648 RepID=UPI0019678E6C|nr:quinoprotein relay system zinc metallohydrolase 2 [Methylococcus sp. EFPC2]QSA98635.1 quinoprotein relay system zinc metallohydrolase 2 [Methylococcus sp. EFPC2]
MLENWARCIVLLAAGYVGVVSAEPLSLQEVAQGVYVHQGVHQLPDSTNHGEIANIGFIVGEKCVAVIDTGGSPAQGDALLAAIKARTAVPVCYVINTHVHPDHIYGNRAFRQPGVIFIGHRKLAQSMAARAPYYRDKANRDLGFTLTDADFIPPDEEVERTRKIDLGGRALTLTAHGPAHTDSDLSVYDDKTRTLWLADLLFLGHVPVVDGSLNGWIKELEILRKIPAARAIPGHGPAVTDWPQAAARELWYLEKLRAEIRAYIKQGRTMEQAIAGVGHAGRAEWALFDEFHKRNVSTAFAELEWEED